MSTHNDQWKAAFNPAIPLPLSHDEGEMEEITDWTESIDTIMFFSARSYTQVSERRKKLIKKMNMREVLKIKLGKALRNVM